MWSPTLLMTQIFDVQLIEYILVANHVDPRHLARQHREIEYDLWSSCLCPHQSRPAIDECGSGALGTSRESRRHVEGTVLSLARTNGDGGRVGN